MICVGVVKYLFIRIIETEGKHTSIYILRKMYRSFLFHTSEHFSNTRTPTQPKAATSLCVDNNIYIYIYGPL